MSKSRCRRFIRGIVRRIPCFITWSVLIILSTIYFVFICPWISNEICQIIPIIREHDDCVQTIMCMDNCVQNECVLCVNKHFCQKVKDNEEKK